MIFRGNSVRNITQRFIVLASVILLVSCKAGTPDVEVTHGTKQGFMIKVKNTADDTLIVDERLLGLGIESSVKVDVADKHGAIVPLCTHLDYVGAGKVLPVAPGGEVTIVIANPAITLTHCLTPDEEYLFRAVLVRQGKVVSRANWIRFRAVSPITAKKKP